MQIPKSKTETKTKPNPKPNQIRTKFKVVPKNPRPSHSRELSALHSISPSKEGHGQIFRLPATLLASGPLPSGLGQLTAEIYYGNL